MKQNAKTAVLVFHPHMEASRINARLMREAKGMMMRVSWSGTNMLPCAQAKSTFLASKHSSKAVTVWYGSFPCIGTAALRCSRSGKTWCSPTDGPMVPMSTP